jgi:hypothetical protein
LNAEPSWSLTSAIALKRQLQFRRIGFEIARALGHQIYQRLHPSHRHVAGTNAADVNGLRP